MGIESNSKLRSFMARLGVWIGTVARVLRNMVRRLYDFVIPPRCLACGLMIPDSHAVCADCWRELDFIAKPWCSRCGEPFAYEPLGQGPGAEFVCARCSGEGTPGFDRLRAVLAYNDGSRALILPFKHSDHTETARLFAKWLVAFGAEALVGVDCIAPVPLHRFRLWHRRYNQSALIAWEVGKITGIRVIPDLIERRRATASQGVMSRQGRATNVAGAFRVKRRFATMIQNKSIVVIDDVLTTGATLNEIAKLLRRHQVSRVNGLVVARVLLTR